MLGIIKKDTKTMQSNTQASLDQQYGMYNLEQGMVTRKNRGHYQVQWQKMDLRCTISSRLRKRLIYPTADPASLRHIVRDVKDINMIDPIAIGDHVHFINNGDGTGHIVDVLPRKNKLSRGAAIGADRIIQGQVQMEQVLVANVDQVVIVMPAAQPAPNARLLDRYLVAAESAELPTLICVTKHDLVKKPAKLAAFLERYHTIGYVSLITSAVSGEGIPQLHQQLTGRISLLMGKSGVGKTSLLNAIQPELGLHVNAVREKDGRGRHTTTHLELFPLDSGGGLIDTPGMREFAFWDIAGSDIAYAFPEMRPYLGQCRFGVSCAHDTEPDCAIKQAVAQGAIHPQRYDSYLRLARE